MRTNPYTAVVGVHAPSCNRKRDSAMSRPNNHPISRRRWLALLAILVVGFALAIVAAVVRWVGYLIPMAVLLGAGLVVLWVLVQLVKRLPGGDDISDWWQ